MSVSWKEYRSRRCGTFSSWSVCTPVSQVWCTASMCSSGCSALSTIRKRTPSREGSSRRQSSAGSRSSSHQGFRSRFLSRHSRTSHVSPSRRSWWACARPCSKGLRSPTLPRSRRASGSPKSQAVVKPARLLLDDIEGPGWEVFARRMRRRVVERDRPKGESAKEPVRGGRIQLLVNDHDRRLRAGDACHLGERAGGIAVGSDPADVEDAVEACVGEWQCVRVCMQESHHPPAAEREAPPALCKHPGAEVEAPEIDVQVGRQLALEERQISAGADAHLEDPRGAPRYFGGQPAELETTKITLAGGGRGGNLERRQKKAGPGVAKGCEPVIDAQ